MHVPKATLPPTLLADDAGMVSEAVKAFVSLICVLQHGGKMKHGPELQDCNYKLARAAASNDDQPA